MRCQFAILALCTAGAISFEAGATVVRGMTLEQKTLSAPTIVLAEVLSQDTHWVREGGSAETVFTLKVKQSFKGELRSGSTFTLLQAGGRIGQFVHEVPGQSPWKKGEQAILFLEPFERHFVEIGVGIGKYGIEQGIVTHAPKVAVAIVEKGRQMKIEAAQPMKPTPLPAFVAQLKGFLEKTTPKTPRPAIQGR
jgi:hypothetical protein